jgi:hypothetical protein
MEKLRDEILQAESTRSDLLKWKLGLVGAIGAAGLGFAGSVDLQHADLVLCALPPVTTYVDLLARHLTLRILVIGAFLRTQSAGESAAYQPYEEFAERARNLEGGRSAFALEDWALQYSSYGLSAAVTGYGAYQLWVSSTYGVPFVVSGVVGALVTFFGIREYTRRVGAVAALGSLGNGSRA